MKETSCFYFLLTQEARRLVMGKIFWTIVIGWIVWHFFGERIKAFFAQLSEPSTVKPVSSVKPKSPAKPVSTVKPVSMSIHRSSTPTPTPSQTKLKNRSGIYFYTEKDAFDDLGDDDLDLFSPEHYDDDESELETGFETNWSDNDSDNKMSTSASEPVQQETPAPVQRQETPEPVEQESYSPEPSGGCDPCD